MLFPTIRFAVFFVVVWVVLESLRRSPRAWRVALLVANWVFYAAWDVTFAGLLACSILANHALARLIVRSRTEALRRWAVRVGVVGNVGVLAVFKYFDFFARSAATTAGRLGIELDPPLLDLVLPLGISFFTFQAISYLVEIRRDGITPSPLLDEAIWLSFFPTVVSGPITRASEFMPQLAAARDTVPDHQQAFLLIVRGLFKKVVLASYLGTAIVDDVFAAPGSYSSVDVVVAVYAFGAQLYCDFSGYVDIGRGVALLMGITLPENFAAPYGATSVNKFWTRWHMTLSRWLRDFVFTPLAKRSPGRWATYRNLLVVMLLAGLWHGAAWTFVAFGAVHGVALACERWWRDERRRRGLKPRRGAMWSALAWVATFNVVAIGWIFFRADSMTEATTLLGRIATGWQAPVATTPLLLAVVAAVIAAQVRPVVAWSAITARFRRLAPAPQAVALASALMVIDVLGPDGIAPFIYFGF